MNANTKNLIAANFSDSNTKTLEFVKLSDTVHSWLVMLNRVIDMCNVVEPEAVVSEGDLTSANAPTYEKLFGFMTSADKRNLDVVMRGISSDEDGTGINASVSSLSVRNSSKKASFPDISGSSSVLYVRQSSDDVQCVNAGRNISISIIPSGSQTYYAEKIVSVLASADITIQYEGNFEFVNNATYPNVGYSAISTPRNTILLENQLLVYKITFVHGIALVEIIQNTQLADNYLAPSASKMDSVQNAVEVYSAPLSACELVSAEMSVEGRSAGTKTMYVDRNGNVSFNSSASDVLSISTSLVLNAAGMWQSMSASCSVMVDGTHVSTESKVLSDGDGTESSTVYLGVAGGQNVSIIVRIVYVLNLAAAKLDVSSISILRGGIRTYDE